MVLVEKIQELYHKWKKFVKFVISRYGSMYLSIAPGID